MPADARLHVLRQRWEEARRRGHILSADALCRDCPELRDEVRRRIELWPLKDTDKLQGASAAAVPLLVCLSLLLLSSFGCNADPGKKRPSAVKPVVEAKNDLLLPDGGKAAAERKVLPKHLENSIGMKLVLIPAGKFLMGSPEGEPDRESWEKGNEWQHEVEITRPFYLGIHEVTQAQYEKVMGTNPSYFSATGRGKASVAGKDTSTFPVETVSWHDAVKFCEELSALAAEKKAGRNYRLPTEAEWEYACRGGARSAYHFGVSLSSEQANCNRKIGRTTPVGFYKQPNAFGLHDMHGNVWEWCADWYSKDYYRNCPKQDPECKGASTIGLRVVRGGSWFSVPRCCRSAFRIVLSPFDRLDHCVGFRVVCVAGARTL
jgi:formylglycine-generating enzyme required for sulfatase activity